MSNLLRRIDRAMWCFVLVTVWIISQVSGKSTPCEAVLNMTEQIELPAVTANTNCSWYINATQTKHAYVTVQSLVLGKGDSVLVFSGPVKAQNESIQVANLNESRSDFMIVASGIWTTITFKAGNANVTEGALNLSFNIEVCHQDLSGDVLGISSPVYLPGTGDISCTYGFQTVVPQNILVLTFSNFKLLNGTSYLVAVDTDKNLGIFTGSTIPDDLFFNSPNVTLTLFLYNSSDNQWFHAVFLSAHPGCSGVESIDDEPRVFTIPANGPIFADCRWVFNSTKGTTLVANVTEVKNLNGADKMIFSDGGSQSSQVLSSLDTVSALPATLVITSGNKLWLRIILDETSIRRHISISVQSQDDGGQFYKSGTVETLANQTINTTAYYQFMVDAESQVQLDLNQTLMYTGQAQVDMYDGTSDYNNKLASFGTNNQFYPVTSTGNRLLMVASNFSGSQHMNATFSGVKPGCDKISTSARDIYNVMLKEPLSQCSWTITPHTYELMVLQLETVHLCDNDTLTIYSGPSNSSSAVATFNSSSVPSKIPLFSFQDGAKIVHQRSTSNCSNATSVDASYWANVKGCGGFLSKIGEIQSPNFPDRYPLNSNCKWDVVDIGTNKTLLYLSVNSLQINPAHSLRLLKDVNSTASIIIANYTGNVLPNDIIVNDTSLYLQFLSENTGMKKPLALPGQGFNVAYRKLECGGSLTNVSGILSTPGFPSPTPSGTDCIWIIVLPESAKNISNIVRFNFTLTESPLKGNGSVLEIREGGSARAPLMKWNKTRTGLLSRTNMLWIHYSLGSKAANDGFSFLITYSMYSCNKSQQCDNGMCLHPNWRCNGENDCGDGSDERNCTKPGPPSKKESVGVKPYWIAIVFFLALALGVFLAVIIPRILRKYQSRNYSNLHNPSI